jgi:DNA-nicking Smr family endonuclease
LEPVYIPIEDVLDLHTFHPGEVESLLDEYFSECIRKEIFSVRVIHGKGKGILKKKVVSILKKSNKVLDFQTAPAAAGGWGAVIVELKRDYRD